MASPCAALPFRCLAGPFTAIPRVALAVKAIFLLLGAFGIANMWWAVFADVGVMILAVLNAMRMLIVEKN